MLLLKPVKPVMLDTLLQVEFSKSALPEKMGLALAAIAGGKGRPVQ
jgi:hypothetical protein